jgi:hypothetical protein
MFVVVMLYETYSFLYGVCSLNSVRLNMSFPRIQEHATYHVLRFLLDSPQFDFKIYSGNDNAALKAPAPVDQLLSGPDHITLQYLLGTVNIPEASYADNDHLMKEFFNQIGWNNVS